MAEKAKQVIVIVERGDGSEKTTTEFRAAGRPSPINLTRGDGTKLSVKGMLLTKEGDVQQDEYMAVTSEKHPYPLYVRNQAGKYDPTPGTFVTDIEEVVSVFRRPPLDWNIE